MLPLAESSRYRQETWEVREGTCNKGRNQTGEDDLMYAHLNHQEGPCFMKLMFLLQQKICVSLRCVHTSCYATHTRSVFFFKHF